MNATAFFGDIEMTENVTWTVSVNGTDCPITSSNYSNSTSNWTIICIAPDVADGLYHNLELTGTYTVTDFNSDVKNQSIKYRDVTAPIIYSVSGDSVTPGNNVTLVVNVTDNINISTVITEITYPNSTIINYTLNLSDGLYQMDFENLTDVGDYEVTAYVNDTIDNLATGTGYFEVFTATSFAGNVLDHQNNVTNVTIELYKVDTVRLLETITLNLTTGNYSGGVHNRNYDVKIRGSRCDILIRDLNLTNLTDPFDIDVINGSNLKDTITGYRPLTGVGVDSNLTNRITIECNYFGLIDTLEDETNITIYKCSSWNYTNRMCGSSWLKLNSTTDQIANTVSANSTSFSAYMAMKAKDIVQAGAPGAAGAAGAAGASGGSSSSTRTTIISGSTGLTVTDWENLTALLGEIGPGDELLDIKLQPLRGSVAPGETLKLQLDLTNFGTTSRVDVDFTLEIILPIFSIGMD